MDTDSALFADTCTDIGTTRGLKWAVLVSYERNLASNLEGSASKCHKGTLKEKGQWDLKGGMERHRFVAHC